MSRSEEVRDFYERMPYPAPLTSLDGYRDLYKNPNRRRAEFHLMWPAKQPRAGLEILIAGCGTSQAARYALREPDARIVAIDVSDTSLRHTRELQRKYNLENLELHQLPIERVHEFGRSFDLVVCTGVLHHLSDPDCGLRALRDVLRPSGAMRLMVYARYARAGIYMMQEYCRLLEISVSATDLRSLGAVLEVLPAGHPISGLLRRSKDFRRPEAMARSCILRIAPTPFRRYMVGSIGAACLSVAGSSRLRTSRNVEYWPVARTLRAWPRCPHGCSTPPPNSSAERWSRIVLSHIATIAPLRTSRSHLPVKVGATTSRLYCHGRCAFGNVCLLAVLRC